MECVKLDIIQWKRWEWDREEEDDSFHYGPDFVAFRMLGLVQGPYTEDGAQSLKPVAKTSAPGLSLCHLWIPLSKQNRLEKN